MEEQVHSYHFLIERLRARNNSYNHLSIRIADSLNEYLLTFFMMVVVFFCNSILFFEIPKQAFSSHRSFAKNELFEGDVTFSTKRFSLGLL